MEGKRGIYLTRFLLLILLAFTLCITYLWSDDNEKFTGLPECVIEIFKDKYEKEIENDAHFWVNKYLKEDYRPPKKSRYCFIRKASEDTCDMIRMRYLTSGKKIAAITQTVFVFLFQLEFNKSLENESLTLEQVKEHAEEVLNNSSLFRFEVKKKSENEIEGRIYPKEKNRNDYPAYYDSFAWWYNRNGLGFYAIKQTKRGGPAAKGFSLSINSRWFTKK